MIRLCFLCKTEMLETTRTRAFGPDRIALVLDQSICPKCGLVATNNAQHNANLAKIRALGLTREEMLANHDQDA